MKVTKKEIYVHAYTGEEDTREGWLTSYSKEELMERELTAEEAFAQDAEKNLLIKN